MFVVIYIYIIAVVVLLAYCSSNPTVLKYFGTNTEYGFVFPMLILLFPITGIPLLMFFYLKWKKYI